jgi:hypothetical protein
MRICPKCGYEAVNSDYCRNCGARMVLAPSLRTKLAWHITGTFVVLLAQNTVERFWATRMGGVRRVAAVTCFFSV